MFLFAHVKFMGTYAAYYKIKEIMIDPLQNDDEQDGEDEPESLPEET